MILPATTLCTVVCTRCNLGRYAEVGDERCARCGGRMIVRQRASVVDLLAPREEVAHAGDQ